jgi:DNA-sulfur modification-associated
MAAVPGVKKLVKFSKEFRGSFGKFKTDHSFPLYYVSMSVPIDSLDDLSTASELFGTDKIDFEELIQRDIDHSRVKKIANDYLSQGEGRVIFFPPLLACVLVLDDDGSPIKQYSDVARKTLMEGTQESALQTTWDIDGFQLDLPLADADSSDRRFQWGDKSRFIYEFAASLRINPKRAKLVVIDGQHRLEALRLLRKNPDQQAIISDLEVPVCVVWAPQATEAGSPNENITRDFRELFVRVNSEPRKVSGHFLTLLRDDSYSAMAVRRLADTWKALDQPGAWSRLHLLEWNTREDERVDVRTRDFSVTTVSIVSKVLEDYLFKAGIAPALLQLETDAGKFAEIDPSFAWDGIDDKTQKSDVDFVVREHIGSILVPSLDLLLRGAQPYRRLENSLGEAFGKLSQKIAENSSSFMALRSVLSAYIYREAEIFEESTLGAYLDFKKWIVIEPQDRVFFLSVFQQALLRLWLTIAVATIKFGADARVAASVTLTAMDALVFSHQAQYLGAGQGYTRRMLWRNESVNFGSAWARKAWLDLIATSLLRPSVRAAAIARLRDAVSLSPTSEKAADGVLLALGEKHFADYADKFREEIYKETKQSYPDFFEEGKAAQLRALQNSEDSAEKTEFEAAVRKRADLRVTDALDSLANQLGVGTDLLMSHVDFS